MDTGDARIAESTNVPAQCLAGLTDVERVDRRQTGGFALTVQLLRGGESDRQTLLAVRHGDLIGRLASTTFDQNLRRIQDVVVRDLFDVAVLGRGACGIV